MKPGSKDDIDAIGDREIGGRGLVTRLQLQKSGSI